jgi:hypothetical protein
MKRFVAARRFLARAALLALVLAPALLLSPQTARAFTLANNFIVFDPISVPIDHTLHVHLLNHLSGLSMDFRTAVKPTTLGPGSTVFLPTITLPAGQGSDQAFTFASFSPPAGTTRVPVVTTIFVSLTPPSPGASPSPPPSDWSGKVASSVEVIDDITGKQIAILGGRHIVRNNAAGAPTFCLSCN